jgi:superfamily II DNA or RNA helicase
MKIKSINKIDYNGDVYNLRIKDNHNYFANNLCVANCHTAKAKTVQSVLYKTFGFAKMRIGMTGTLPNESSLEILMLESTHGPVIQRTTAKNLMDKGLISNVKIKAILLHHDNRKFAESVYNIRKRGDGQKAWQLEREYVANSAKRKQFVKTLVDKFKSNSLVLFHTIEFGTELYNYLKDNCQNKDIFYIDGSTKMEKRDYIKKKMEDTSGNPKILIASFGTTSTGVNIKAITNIIFAQSFKSDQVIRQSIGRGLRLHSEKNKLIVFDLVDVFHSDFKTILQRQYESRRDDIYKKQRYPYDELKIKL